MVSRKLVLRVLLTLMVASLLVIETPSQGYTQEKEVVLKAVTCWPITSYMSEPFREFQQRVNQRLKGKLTINYLGANEVIPSPEQFEALRSGVVGVALLPATFYVGQIPEAHALLFVDKHASQLRKSGFYDLMRKIHLEKGGVIYLTNVSGNPGAAFRLFTGKKLQSLDLTGLRFRATPAYTDVIKGLGGTPITIPTSEVYTAMERGVVDGYGWSFAGLKEYGLQEVTKYVIDHPFYTFNHSIQFNADVWKKLPEDVRNTLEEIGKEMEEWTDTYMAKVSKDEDEMLKGFGVERLNFGPEGTKKIHDVAYGEPWKTYIANNPQYGPQLKALMDKAEY